ncbi:MAG: alkaline phosphatase family protein [Sedimentisphaerales bacterium]|nr:alkaline phosphatase family protein [Sedimentisphaerales bacterium]
MKVIIIGLDGVTWDVLDNELLEHHMPTLARLKKEGCYGDLRSTDPATTSTAWTSFLTGCKPSKHGVFGYQNYSFENGRMNLVNSSYCRVPTFFEELSRQGLKVVGINVPWTYPCPKVNGVMVAGFGCPIPDAQFTYPPELKEEIFKKIPDYDISPKNIFQSKMDIHSLENDIRLVKRSFEQKYQVAQLVSEKVDWDVMMVQFQDTDVIHHHVWSYVGKEQRDRYPRQRDLFFGLYNSLDDTVARILMLGADTEQKLAVIVSDHGGMPLFGEVRPNVLLEKWGYLKTRNSIQEEIGRIFKKARKTFFPLEPGDTSGRILNGKVVKWKAAVLHAASTLAYLYLNADCTDEHKEEILKTLKNKFENVFDPVTQKPIFNKVETPEEYFGRSNLQRSLVGDLVLEPQAGYEIRCSFSKRKGYLHSSADPLAGTHKKIGVYILCGPQIQSCNGSQKHIVDIAPTLYAALDLPLPEYLDGSVFREAFTSELNVRYQTNSQSSINSAGKEKRELTEKQEDAIVERLKTLGYM